MAAAAGLTEQRQATDIGAPATAGWSFEAGDTYVILPAGGDIGGTADQFHFVYQTLTGDGAVTARVRTMVRTDAWAQAGVMIRESLTAESRHATMAISTRHGYVFQRRPETAGETLQTSESSAVLSGWIRLVRAGDLFEAYQSPDGAMWVKVGSDTVPMGATVYVGLAATRSNRTASASIIIDGFSVVANEPPSNEPPAVSITSPTAQSQYTAPMTLALEAIATDPEGRLSSVDFYADSTLLGRDDNAPYAMSWSTSIPGTYSLTAVAMDADGGTTTSGAVPVIIAAPNQPPIVSLTSPGNGASFTTPATIDLTALASDAEGHLTRVEFYNGTTLLGTDTTAPYTFSWTNVPPGAYSLTVQPPTTMTVPGRRRRHWP